ncbi:MAG: class I SAM-dependent methyltransferase [Povalibacter sp.]
MELANQRRRLSTPSIFFYDDEALELMDAEGRPSTRSTLMRLILEPDYRRRVVRYALGKPVELATHDRRELEQVIIPYYTAQPDVHSILFIGVAWYTRHYPRNYFAGKNLWTIDIDPAAAKHGARQHITASVTDLQQSFAPGTFDCVMMNGVYGHGLKDAEDCEKAFAACYEVLRAGGHLLLGWNDLPEYRGAPLSAIESLNRFEPVQLPPFGTHRHLSDPITRHIYQFFRKPVPSSM